MQKMWDNKSFLESNCDLKIVAVLYLSICWYVGFFCLFPNVIIFKKKRPCTRLLLASKIASETCTKILLVYKIASKIANGTYIKVC